MFWTINNPTSQFTTTITATQFSLFAPENNKQLTPPTLFLLNNNNRNVTGTPRTTTRTITYLTEVTPTPRTPPNCIFNHLQSQLQTPSFHNHSTSIRLR